MADAATQNCGRKPNDINDLPHGVAWGGVKAWFFFLETLDIYIAFRLVSMRDERNAPISTPILPHHDSRFGSA
jgi:hypothetical protein